MIKRFLKVVLFIPSIIGECLLAVCFMVAWIITGRTGFKWYRAYSLIDKLIDW